MLQQQYPELREPILVLKELSADELMREEQLAYEKANRDELARIHFETEKAKAEGIAEGEAKGKAEGIAEGEAKGKAEVARIMLQDGMQISLIAKFTGLAPEEIELLKAH
jgi:predicted transposase/invertase (TIGR01784 family)